MAEIKYKAVIAGAFADNAGTLFAMNFLAAALLMTGLSENEVMERLKSTSGLLLGLIIGLGCTVGGGYLAGRIARTSERLHGALVAVIGVIIALAFRDGGDPLWFEIAGLAAMLPAGMVGGHLAGDRRRSPAGPGGKDTAA